MISVHFQDKPFNITVIQVYTLTSNVEEGEVEWFYEDLQDLLKLTPPNDVLFIIGDWNAKLGSQEIPGVTGNFSLGVQNVEGQRLTEFCQEKTLVLENSFLITQEKTTYGHDQMVYTEIRLIIFFVAKDGEVLYNQQKQDWKLTVAQTMTPYCLIQT